MVRSRTIFLVLGGVFAWCLGWAALIYARYALIGTDGTFYALMAESLAAGRGLEVFGQPHTVFSPLLPMLAVPIYALTGQLELAVHAVPALLAAGAVPLVYLAVRRVGLGQAPALCATLLAAANGFLIWTSAVSVSAQLVAGFFAALTFWLLIRAAAVGERLRLVDLAVAAGVGVTVALSYLARPEYFFSIVPVVAFLAIVHGRRLGARAALATAAAAAVAFLAVASPYLSFLHRELGYLTISGRSHELVLIATSDYERVDAATGEPAAAVVAPPVLEQSLVQVVRSNVWPLFKRLLDGLVNVEHSFLRTFGLLGVALFAYGLRRAILERRFVLLGAAAVSFVPVAFIAFGQGGTPNYLVQFFFLVAALAGLGAWALVEDIGAAFHHGRCGRRWTAGLVVGVTCLYLAMPAVQLAAFLPADYAEREFKAMGLWMRRNLPGIEAETVVARKTEVSFYARAGWALVPNVDDVGLLIEWMRRHSLRYLSIDDRYLPDARPGLVGLLQPSAAPPELKLVHQAEVRGRHVLLYELAR